MKIRIKKLKTLSKSSHTDRYACSHRSIRTLTPTDVNARIDRCETTSLKIFMTYMPNSALPSCY